MAIVTGSLGFNPNNIGPAAEEIEELLGQLTRLTPESAVLDQINLGARAWAEYLQRYYQKLTGGKFAED